MGIAELSAGKLTLPFYCLRIGQDLFHCLRIYSSKAPSGNYLHYCVIS